MRSMGVISSMAPVRVFDVETTGIDPSEHRVIEIAAFDLYPDNRIERVGAYLTNPGRSIPPEASAKHHLTDGDVASAPPFGAVWAHFANGPTVYAAHNCEFEQGYIPAPQETRWICTYKCALRAWPDAPGHSNQALRYWIGLDSMTGFDRKSAAVAHRAEPDAYVTTWLLMILLGKHSLDELLQWTKEPKFYARLPFGKHRSKKWAEVPADYLEWMCDQRDMDADWRYGAKIELKRRELGAGQRQNGQRTSRQQSATNHNGRVDGCKRTKPKTVIVPQKSLGFRRIWDVIFPPD